MEQFTNNELERRVDEVLFYKWDPIGVNHYVIARAEYRSYVSRILKELESGNLHKLVAMLEDIQVNSMGLNSERSNVKEIAELLLSHKEAIENGRA